MTEATQPEASVNEPCLAYNAMEPGWKLPRALMGGTREMQRQGTTYLPQYESESDTEYDKRKKASILYNAYRRTVRVLTGQPFQKPVTLQNAPDWCDDMAADIDQQGTTLTAFLRQQLEDGLVYGKYHFYVDMPDVREERSLLGRSLNLREERELEVRPYFARYRPDHLIGWRGKRTQGVERLERARAREWTDEPKGEWGERTVLRVRVFYPDRIDVYKRESADDEGGEAPRWSKEESLANELTEIAMVTGYGLRTGFLRADPPLEDLAWVNLKYWQSNSDQDNILKYARVYLLAFMGFEEEETDVVEIGGARGISHRNPNAHVDVVEHSGSSINAGKEDLEDKRELMRSLGSDLLVPRAQPETATGRQMDKAENISDLQAIVRELETRTEQAFRFAAQWRGEELADDFKVDIYQDFETLLMAEKSLEALEKDLKMGVISKRVYLQERKRRGLYTDSLDIEETIAEAEEEFGSLDDFNDDDVDDELDQAAG